MPRVLGLPRFHLETLLKNPETPCAPTLRGVMSKKVPILVPGQGRNYSKEHTSLDFQPSPAGDW